MGAPILNGRGWHRLVVVVAAVACDPSVTGPGAPISGDLRVRPELLSAVDPAVLGLTALHLVVTGASDGRTVVDTTLDYDYAAQDTLGWYVTLRATAESMAVRVEVLAAAQVMFALDSGFVVTEGLVGRSGAHLVELPYVGPGADLAQLTIAPADSVVGWADTVRYTADGRDASGNPVAPGFIAWTTDDSTIASFSDGSLLHAPAAGRSSVVIAAVTPSGVRDSTNAWFRPGATALRVVAGDGARGTVDDTVRLEVEVAGSDGAPLDRVPVRFASGGGGAVGDTVVWSNTQGRAATTGRLGTAVGDYIFTATVEGIPPGTMTATADPGAAAAMVFTVQPASGTAGEIITPPITLELRDAFGNVAGTSTADVVLSLRDGPAGSTVSGTLSKPPLNGVVTFDDISLGVEGTGYVFRATVGSLQADSDPFAVYETVNAVDITPAVLGPFRALQDTIQLTATTTGASGDTLTHTAVAWSTTDSAVAIVDPNGVVTAVHDGVAAIVATAGAAGDTVAVAVQQFATSVTLQPTAVTFAAVGASSRFTATAHDANGFLVANASFGWVVLDAAVASVDTAGTVTARRGGSTSVVAEAGTGADTAQVTITQVATSVVVAPSNPTLHALGDTVHLRTTATDANGNPIPAPGSTWSSGNTAVVTVGPDGVVTAVGNGSTTVTTTTGSVADTIAVSVSQTVSGLVVSPEAPTLAAIDDTVHLTVSATDANGNPIAGAVVTWASTDPSVAGVTGTGVTSAAGNGTARIIASAMGIADTATVTVQQVAATVVVTPAPASFTALGDQQQFSAQARDANGYVVPNPGVLWSTDDGTVASVSVGGLVTSTGSGGTTVNAAVGGAVGSSDVTVRQDVAAVTVTPTGAAFGAIGDQTTFTAAMSDANGNPIPSAQAAWSSSNTAVVTVDSNGRVSSAGDGTAFVVAGANGVADTATVTVAQVVTAVTVTPSAVTLDAIDAAQALQATATDANGFPVPGAAVSWSSSDPSVSVGSTGVVTAVAEGNATVAAAANGVNGTANVVVTQVAAATTVTPATLSFAAVGDTIRLSASAVDANGYPLTNPVVTWTSADPAVAAIDAGGLVTSIGNGSVDLTGTVDTAADMTPVTVRQVVTGIAVTPASTGLSALGDTAAFTAAMVDANGVPVTGTTPSWSVGAGTVASIDPSGVVTGLANGTTAVIVTADGVADTATLTVQQIVTDVTVSPGAAAIAAIGATELFGAAFVDANGNPVAGAVGVWSSTDPAVATVDQSGVATAVDNGSTSIVLASGSAADTATLTVQQIVASVSVAPSNGALSALGDTQSFTAGAADANGNPIAGVMFNWTSTATAVASIDQSGLATALDNGATGIVAEAGGVADTAQLQVQQAVASVVATPPTASLGAFDDTQQFGVTVTDANGNAVTTVAPTWTSTDTAVATVNQTGLASARGNGAVDIVVTAGAVADTVTLTVQQIAASVTVAPDSATVVVEELQQFSAVVRDANGYAITGAAVTWTTSDPDLLAVDPNGVVTADADVGVALVVATSNGVSDSAVVTVVLPD